LLTMTIATSAGVAGLVLSFVFYGTGKVILTDHLVPKTNFLVNLSRNKFFFDEIYDRILISPLTFVFYCVRIFDQYILDGLVDLVAHMPRVFALAFRPIQNGLVQFYALAMILAVTVFLIALARLM